MSEFDRAFELVVGHEGGYVNDPRDPGGETKFGISKHAYPQEDIKGMTLDRAKGIYKKDFWEKLRCESMPRAVAFTVFDAGVNCGLSHAAEWLQKVVGVTVDGVIGPRTLEAVAQASGAIVAMKINAVRLVYHSALPTWDIYGRGWARRIASNIMLIGD